MVWPPLSAADRLIVGLEFLHCLVVADFGSRALSWNPWDTHAVASAHFQCLDHQLHPGFGVLAVDPLLDEFAGTGQALRLLTLRVSRVRDGAGGEGFCAVERALGVGADCWWLTGFVQWRCTALNWLMYFLAQGGCGLLLRK